MYLWECGSIINLGKFVHLQNVVNVYVCFGLEYLVVLSHGGAGNPIQDPDISP